MKCEKLWTTRRQLCANKRLFHHHAVGDLKPFKKRVSKLYTSKNDKYLKGFTFLLFLKQGFHEIPNSAQDTKEKKLLLKKHLLFLRQINQDRQV